MSAALIDLVSVGVQDAHLTGSPEASFFRQSYRRYTNFAMKPERLDYIGTFGAGNEVVIPIKSKGDLLSYVWIEGTGLAATRDDATGFFQRSATDLTEFSLWIGGQLVCTMDSMYIQGVHNPLMRDSSAKASFCVSLNHKKENHSGNYYMLPFFFSEDWSKALPLLALSYHEVEIRVKCRGGSFAPSAPPKVYANFIFLDSDERKFFTDREHELLITQVQNQRFDKSDKTVDITYFNHPCKSLHVVSGNANGQAWNHATDGYKFGTSSLYINGNALFENTSDTYHHDVVPEMHTTDLPDNILDDLTTFSWPFCLTMSKQQPTGSLNFSRIDTAKLTFSNPQNGNHHHRIYATNYNILRIRDGLGGVAYGN